MAAPSVVVLAPGDNVVPQGPFGGSSGNPFYDGVGDIVKITVTYSDNAVCSLQTVYRQTPDDTTFTSQLHGTVEGSSKSQVIDLDCPDERLLQVKGRIGTLEDPRNYVGDEAAVVDNDDDFVSSITFVTTKRSYGPYGAAGKGRQFQSSPLGKVVGFFGRAGSYINSIGTFTDFHNSHTDVVPDGPWGGIGGSVFYDGRADKIKRIDVEYDEEAIISLDVTYDQGTKGFLSALHGGGGGDGAPHGTKVPIAFDEDEYLAQVQGTYGSTDYHGVLTSLTFMSNKKTFGPFGSSSAITFESRPGSQILGFYGKAGSRVNQIGVFTATAPPPPVVLSGGFGGTGGSPWYDGRGEISGITVNYKPDDVIGQIQVTYLQGDQQFDAALHGKNPLTTTARIPLDFPDEYLVQVKGTHGQAHGNPDIVLSLQFKTNKTTYGPFGNAKAGTAFEIGKDEHYGRIVGLYGRSANLLDQIGAIVAPAPKPLPNVKTDIYV